MSQVTAANRLHILIMIFPVPLGKPADRCFLTSDELAQWSEHYQVHGPDSDTIPKVPDGGHFVTLKAKQPQQQQVIIYQCNRDCYREILFNQPCD